MFNKLPPRGCALGINEPNVKVLIKQKFHFMQAVVQLLAP